MDPCHLCKKRLINTSHPRYLVDPVYRTLCVPCAHLTRLFLEIYTSLRSQVPLPRSEGDEFLWRILSFLQKSQADQQQ